jgi:hypothetical protein
MTTMLQFSRNIRKIGSKIENNALEVVKKTSKKALRSLVLGTPVDTGQARSNWRVSIGNPTSSVIPPYAPGKHLGISERANAQTAISKGIATINTLRVGKKRGTGQAGQALYITNAIPYLTKLRLGSSTQQPNDWVRTALIEALVTIQSTRIVEK